MARVYQTVSWSPAHSRSWETYATVLDEFREKDFKRFEDDKQYQDWRRGLENSINVGLGRPISDTVDNAFHRSPTLPQFMDTPFRSLHKKSSGRT